MFVLVAQDFCTALMHTVIESCASNNVQKEKLCCGYVPKPSCNIL